MRGIGAEGDVGRRRGHPGDLGEPIGDDIGELDNLLVVPSTGYIPFALIAAGGLFGLGEKLVPVPFSALQYDPEYEMSFL